MKRLIFAVILALLIVCQITPAHAGVMGSVALANIRLSLVNGTAFVDFSAANTLTPYTGWKLTLTDSAGKKAVGYIKAAGTGETYDTNLVVNGGFDSDTSGWSAGASATLASVAGGQSGNCLQITENGGTNPNAYPMNNVTLVTGAAYLVSAYVKTGTEATYYIDDVGTVASGWTAMTGESDGTWTQKKQYFTSKSTTTKTRLVNQTTSGSGKTIFYDTVAVTKLLTPSPTGVTITSTRGGTTYSWASIESGFNYNDASGYTYTLIAPVTGGMFLGLGFGF
jgi:hypothetical protein